MAALFLPSLRSIEYHGMVVDESKSNQICINSSPVIRYPFLGSWSWACVLLNVFFKESARTWETRTPPTVLKRGIHLDQAAWRLSPNDKARNSREFLKRRGPFRPFGFRPGVISERSNGRNTGEASRRAHLGSQARRALRMTLVAKTPAIHEIYARHPHKGIQRIHLMVASSKRWFWSISMPRTHVSSASVAGKSVAVLWIFCMGGTPMWLLEVEHFW